MIRKLSVHDFNDVYSLINEQASRYQYLKPAKHLIRSLFTDCASNAQNFGRVSVVDGKIVGVLCAISHSNLWAEKNSSSVMIWACNKSGDGVAMLREYRAWLDSRPVIRRGGFQFDLDVDSRILKVIDRLGFKRHGGCYLRVKGG